MRISDIIQRKIGILGFGIEGRSVLAALRRGGHSEPVHVITREVVSVPEGVVLQLANHTLPALPALDVIVRSPGFAPNHPLRLQLTAAGIAQTTATQLFMHEARELGASVIGITGSKGKSTTSTLTHLTLEAADVPSVLVGNVGVSALDVLPRLAQERVVAVMELSSYQCADLVPEFGPSIAALLDLFPEHLDWHGGLDAYYRAKLRIIETQRETDTAFYNEHTGELAKLLASLPARARPMNTPQELHFQAGWFLRGSEPLFSDAGMLLPGAHNRRNAVSALMLAECVGAQPQHLQRVLRSFAGLPYRLQRERSAAGIHWINDAISTAPEAVAAALAALQPAAKVTTLIVGGQSRGLDQTVLIRALAQSSVRTLIALPDTGAQIARSARDAGLTLQLREVEELAEAVQLAAASTAAGETCLYSPGAPSYNRYSSFQERGALFRKLLDELDPGA